MDIKATALVAAGRGLILAKKYSPELLTGLGIVGGVTAAILGAKATLKLEPVVDQHEEAAEHIHQEHAHEFSTKQEHDRAMAKLYVKTGLVLVKIYGPPVTIGSLAIFSVLAAHGIMRERNVALVAAYSILEQGYSTYRKRVIDEFGEDKDRDFRLGIRETKSVDEATGKKITTVEIDPTDVSGYARFFDEYSMNHTKDPEYNLMFLRAQQNFANDRLIIQGWLLLNDVYDALGFDRTRAGAHVGWVISKNGGDNHIDFGIYDARNERKRSFVNGQEEAILLDFNVDGVILDKI